MHSAIIVINAIFGIIFILYTSYPRETSALQVVNGFVSLPLFTQEDEEHAIKRLLPSVMDTIRRANATEQLNEMLEAFKSKVKQFICLKVLALHKKCSIDGAIHKMREFLEALLNYLFTCSCRCGQTGLDIVKILNRVCLRILPGCHLGIILSIACGGEIDPLALATSITYLVCVYNPFLYAGICLAGMGDFACSQGGRVVKPDGIATY